MKRGSFIYRQKLRLRGKPKQFNGTSAVVKTARPVSELAMQSILTGWEPHFAVAYGDIVKELAIWGNMLNIEVEEY